MEDSRSSFSNPFGDIATNYDQFRPSYPVGFFAQLSDEMDRVASSPRRVVDVGCGSGISTRQLAQCLKPVDKIIGLDASPEMLRVARSEGRASATVRYVVGLAEAIPVASGSCSAITACQSVQWFDRTRFYCEAARVLLPDGLFAIMQNNRAHKRCRFLSDYESLLEEVSPDYRRTYRNINFEHEIGATEQFQWLLSACCRWQRTISKNEFECFTRTSSKAQAAILKIGDAEWSRRVDELWQLHRGDAINGIILYESEMFIFRRTTTC
jgi:ubiquinone/menaquinone biosynthesis C-methylase UbiE